MRRGYYNRRLRSAAAIPNLVFERSVHPGWRKATSGVVLREASSGRVRFHRTPLRCEAMVPGLIPNFAIGDLEHLATRKDEEFPVATDQWQLAAQLLAQARGAVISRSER